MNLQQLFHFFHLQGDPANLQTEVTGLFVDSRKVKPGGVFFAVKGVSHDGHENIPDAINNGAAAIVCSDRRFLPELFKGSVLQIQDVRNFVSLIASRYYQFPSQEMWTVGVTGTNGKTSVTYLLEALLNSAGTPTAVMGTINHHLLDHVWPTEMTTPDPIILQKRLYEFKAAGAKAVAMEVSSHALDQKRVESVAFDAVVFTNLTRDHLDYHGTMEAYQASKQRLFTDLMWKSTKTHPTAIINSDDPVGRRLRVAEVARLLTYGKSDADFQFEVKHHDWSGTQFQLKSPYGVQTLKVPLLGEHNLYNTVAAIAVGHSANVSLEKVRSGLEHFKGIPGRLQKVPLSEVHAFVDYAHTPDALEKVLTILQKLRGELSRESKIISVFGCGGDRDPGKRPIMGRVAERLSDVIIVTSDNPRSEDPDRILDDIYQGLQGQEKAYRIVDRREALRKALEIAQKNDIILVAGKGHENYQILGTERFVFDDFQVVLEEGNRGANKTI